MALKKKEFLLRTGKGQRTGIRGTLKGSRGPKKVLKKRSVCCSGVHCRVHYDDIGQNYEDIGGDDDNKEGDDDDQDLSKLMTMVG